MCALCVSTLYLRNQYYIIHSLSLAILNCSKRNQADVLLIRTSTYCTNAMNIVHEKATLFSCIGLLNRY